MAESHSLEFFRSQVTDLARPYFWKATFTANAFGKLSNKELLQATLRTSAIPGITLNEVSVNYFGMMFKMAGTPTYEPMQAQFIIDNEYANHAQWHDVINEIFKYTKENGPCWNDPASYMGTVELQPLNCSSGPGEGPQDISLTKFKLEMAYLSSLSSVQFNHDTKDSPLTFDATITYSYFTREN